VKWIASPSAVYSDLDGMTALLDTHGNVYYCLSGIGPFVWENLRKGASADEICDAVTENYDVSPSVAHADVTALLDRLSSAGLIVTTDA
jgi:hypothetical protein